MTTIDMSTLYAPGKQAKLADMAHYEQRIRHAVPAGDDVTLTGAAPVWLYLRIAHALHGHARSLAYHSPVTGSVSIFDHNPH